MKSLQKLSLIGLTIALLFSSCAVEKRLYRPGYHTDWAKNKHNPEKQQVAVKTAEQTQAQIQAEAPTSAVAPEELQLAANTIDTNVDPIVSEDNMTASLDNTPILLSPKTISFDKKDNITSAKTNPIAVTKSITLNKKELKNKLRELRKAKAASSNDGYLLLRIVGWILVVLGIISIITFNVIGGVISILVGAALIIIFR